jgi:hypothetical protein
MPKLKRIIAALLVAVSLVGVSPVPVLQSVYAAIATGDTNVLYKDEGYTLRVTPTDLPPLSDSGSYFPRYSHSSRQFHEGMVAIVLEINADDRRYGFMDKTGKVAISMEYDDVGDFSEGLAWVSKAGKYGAIDKEGNIVIPLVYNDVGPCRDGLMTASLDGEYGGYIDRDDNVAIPFEYDVGCYFSDGLALARKDGKWRCIDKNNNIVFYTDCDKGHVFSEGFAVIAQLTGEIGKYGDPLYKYGCVDKSGNVILPMEYDGALGFSEGLMAVYSDGLAGYVDTTGKTVIEFQYEEAYSFKDGLAEVAIEGFGPQDPERINYIDRTGKAVFSLADVNEKAGLSGFNRVVFSSDVFSGGLARGRCGISELYMYFDKSGNMVLSGADGATNFSEGLALAQGIYDGKAVVAGGKRDQFLIIEKVPTPAASAQTTISVVLNGTPVSFDQPPIIEDNRTLVPLRAIFEAMGAAIVWDGDTRTVTATKNNIVVVMIIGNDSFTRNGVAVSLDVPAKIVGNRTLVPARAVAESFGAHVKWDGGARVVTITT